MKRVGLGALVAAMASFAAPALAQVPVPPIGGGDPPPPPPPPAVAPAAPGTDAVTTEGFDAAHTFWSGDGSLRPPFGVLWKAKLKAIPDQVVTGGGRVFVQVSDHTTSDEPEVVGLDGASGKRLWRLKLRHTGDIAFAGGVVLVAADDRLRALNPASGAVVWNHAEGGIHAITAIGGDVAFRSTATGGAVRTKLVDAASGASRWEFGNSSYTPDPRPSAAGDRIYFADECNAEALDRRSGGRIWSRNLGCSGSGYYELSRLTDTRIAIATQGYGAERWLRAQDGAEASKGGPVEVLADGVGIGTGDNEFQKRAFNLADGSPLWSFTSGHRYEPEAIAVADQAIVTDERDLRVLGLHDGRERAAARLQGAQFVGRVVAGGGLLLIGDGNALLAAAPQSRTGPPRLHLKLPPYAHPFGRPYRVRGVAGGALTRRTEVRVLADPYPYGRGPQYAATVVSNLDGRFTVRRSPSRATLYSFSAEGGKPQRWIGLVLPDYKPHFTHPTPTSVLVRVSVRLPRSVPARGHVLGIYLGRARAKRYYRLAATHLRGRRGSFRGTMRFTAVAHLGRRDFVAFCVGGLLRHGIGFGDRLDHRCGAATVRF
jgi:outer membrane protein assembly factor BamB